MNYLPVVGFDPSLSNWGWAKGRYCIDNSELEINSIGVIITKKSTQKQQKVSSDDIYRSTVLAQGALDIINGSSICFSETPFFSQNGRASIGNGIGYGIIGCLKVAGYNIIEITPDELKKATVGKSTGTKKEIITRAVTNWPDLEWPTNNRKGIVSVTDKKAEHMADAIGAIEAGILSDEFKKLLTMYTALT